MRENAHDWQWNESCTLNMTGREDISAWRRVFFLARNVRLRFPFIGSTPTFLYFDLYLNTAYAAHNVY